MESRKSARTLVAVTTWSADLVGRIADTLKRTRNARGITAAELSDRTAELGLRITRAVVSDLETKRKKSLDVGEVIVLAEALDVPLLDLLTAPVEGMGVVEYLPGLKLRPAAARAHYAGLGLDRVRDALDLDMYMRVKSQAGLDQILGDDDAVAAAHLVLVDAKIRELRERLGLPAWPDGNNNGELDGADRGDD